MSCTTWVRRKEALARPALIVFTLAVLIGVSVARDRGEQSFAQEGAATPASVATPATPVAIDFDQLVDERPGLIRSGPCDDPGETIASLTALDVPEGEAQGQGAAIEAERSYTSLPIPFESLLAGQTSLSLLLSADESDVAIACGEIGGVPGDDGSLVIKLSEQNGSGFTGIAFLAPGDAGSTGASVFLAGERNVAETRELVAAAPDAVLEQLPVPTPTAEPVQVADLVLLEWLIDMPEETRAGPVNFVVTNEGSEPHGLVIESGGVVVAELPDPIDPGQATVLSVTLPEGLYVVYCPLGDGAHREEGMEGALVVVP